LLLVNRIAFLLQADPFANGRDNQALEDLRHRDATDIATVAAWIVRFLPIVADEEANNLLHLLFHKAATTRSNNQGVVMFAPVMPVHEAKQLG